MDAATETTTHPTADQLEAGTHHVLASPTEAGRVEMIVARPEIDEREVLAEGRLEVGSGLVGDNYLERGNDKTPDGAAHPEAQLNLMSSRAVDLVAAGDRDRWALAGDQFFVDFLFSDENTPPGTRLAIGDAVIEIPEKPHNGCAKFSRRFGVDAAKWVNSGRNRDGGPKLRGVNAVVVQAGTVRTGDEIRKL